MDEKQSAPPSYAEASGYNSGYAPPAGDQGGNRGAYPPQPQTGYPAGYGTGYSQPSAYSQPAGYSQPAAGYNYQQQSTVVVTQPGFQQGTYINAVPDHMGLAIFTTICCCWPLGLVAIMRAQESRRALDRGDIPAASTYSAEARRYSMWAIAGGCISIVLAIVIIVVVVTQNSYYYSNYD